MFKKYYFYKRHDFKGLDFVDIYEETEKHYRLVCTVLTDVFDVNTYKHYKSLEF